MNGGAWSLSELAAMEKAECSEVGGDVVRERDLLHEVLQKKAEYSLWCLKQVLEVQCELCSRGS